MIIISTETGKLISAMIMFFREEIVMKLSFVIPCYRSEKTIELVYEELLEVIAQRQDYFYEIIMVNDDSPDNVYGVLERLASKDKNVKVIDFAKNMGKHAALMAGFRNSTGDYIICLDDDGQCPVDHLWELLEPLEKGFDVSMAQYGIKKQSSFKNFGSKMNDWMMTTMLGKPKEFQFANFAAMKKFVVEEVIKYNNPYSYVNGLLLRTTNKLANVPMEERERVSGTGGYTFFKSLKLWVNGYTAFSITPLRIATLLGCIFAVAGFIFAFVTIIRKIINPSILAGYTSLMAILLILSGITMLILGILGEYVGRIYMCINESPQYVVRQTLNIEKSKK